MLSFTAQRGKQKVRSETGCKTSAIFFRMYVLTGLCFFGFAVVLGRAVYLHLVDNEGLRWIAKKQYNATVPVSIRRGKIFDRNGEEMAVSLPVPSIYADPAFIEDPAGAVKKLSGILKMKEDDLFEKLKSGRRFVWLKRQVSYDVLNEVNSLRLPGINYIEESKRFYPNGELASQVLGAVGYDSQALAGIELAYNDFLISRKKTVSYERDAKGRLYAAPVGFGEQTDVGAVYLTIDKQIQFMAESALMKGVREANAPDGMAIVMDAKSGAILAMASAPEFDPNRYGKYPVSAWRNRAVTDSFEPGSTFKVMVVAAALNAGAVAPETVFNCEGGAYRIGTHILKDAHPHGKLEVRDIIRVSSNIGAMKIAFALGKEKLYETLREFGIGAATGIDFPGEAAGVMRNFETWQPVEHATMAFGQGLSVTPLQMAAAFASVVNGGVYFRPHLVQRVIGRNGNVIKEAGPEVMHRPITGEVSEELRTMMKRVVEPGGTGVRARSESYEVGGKTGTAQKVSGGKGYAKGKYFSSFIGFAPVFDPRIVVFVGIDEPRGAYYGGAVAAPLVKEIIEGALTYMRVPSNKSQVFMAGEDREAESIADYAVAETVPEEKSVTRQMRRPKFEKVAENKFVMPDLSGLTMREVLGATEEPSLDVNADGTGIAVEQSPLAGAIVGAGEKLSVRFEMPR